VIEQVLTTQADALKFVERIIDGRAVPSIEQLVKLLPELAAPTERLQFNTTVQGPQKLAWVEIPLARIKALKEVCGCSVNDVALTLVTAAIRRYAALHGEELNRRLLRIMVPVNIRDDSRRGGLGNEVSIIPVTIPLNIQNPRKLLAAVHERTEFLKKTHVAELASLAGGLLGMFPAAMQALAGPLATRLPITPFNLVCTNVPGPQFPLYMMGHKMLTWYPYVPIGGDMALNVAVLSYNGTVYFGFSGDANIAPDLARLENFLAASMQELEQAAGIHPRKKPIRAKARAAGVTAPVANVISVPAPSAQPKRVSEERKAAAAVA
jgi:diacylglycerol O-acyltransferase / wax synthase